MVSTEFHDHFINHGSGLAFHGNQTTMVHREDQMKALDVAQYQSLDSKFHEYLPVSTLPLASKMTS